MRIEQITFTRFLAAVAIVIFHQGLDVFPFNNQSIAFLFIKANVGVSYFFLLSGFVMIVAYSNKSKINPFEYFKNRFARIYPVYLIAIVLLLILNILTSAKWEYKSLLLNIFVAQAWIPGQALSFNYPGWSLSVEFLFYALFPFLFNFIYQKIGYKSLVLPIVLFWVASQVAFQYALSSSYFTEAPSKGHALILYFPFMHLNEFLIGNVAGLYFMNELNSKNRNYDWLIMITVFLIIITLKYTSINFHNGLMSILFVPLIILLSLNTGNLTRLFNKKLFVFLGEISFGVYILQVPVYYSTAAVLSYLHFTNNAVVFYISLIVLIIASAVSYIFIETPTREKIKQFRLTKR